MSPRIQKYDGTGVTVNSFFEKIYVLNLDRRHDRWKRFQQSAQQVGLNADRFPAADGLQQPYLAQFEAYASEPLASVPDESRIRSTYQYCFDYPSQPARVAFIEQQNGRKAIESPGAWGYLCTMIQVLEHAIENRYERILVLDDDVLFHKSMNELFAQVTLELPEDWLILQLGALQYRWGDEWIEWRSEHLYHCRGCSLGSHAVGMHGNVLPQVLEETRKFNLPYDEGALHLPKALYPRRCLTAFPNLMIQDVTESDISSKTYQRKAKTKRNILRWDWKLYA